MKLQTIVVLIFSLANIHKTSFALPAQAIDDGYINPPPPPVEGYDAPKEGYDVPEEGYDAPKEGYDAPEEEERDPCFSYDTDSPLNDINPAPYAVDGAFGTKDIYECQKLCQNTYECNYFVFDTRLFSKKCWLKTGKSFILPPLFGVILGPKHCNDGYEAPKDSVNSYDAPPAPRDNYEEPKENYEEPEVNSYDAPPAPRDNYEEPKENYEEPEVNSYDAPPAPRANYEEPKEAYEEPKIEDNYEVPIAKPAEPTSGYQEPESSYQEPEPSYKEPKTEYKEPDSTYEEPRSSQGVIFPQAGA